MNLEQANRLFERFAAGVLRRKVTVLILIVLIVGAFVSRIPKMHFTASFESFFVEDDPEIVTYDRFQKEFGNDKTVYVLVEPKDGHLFTLDNMRVLQKVTADLEKTVPYLDEVISVTNTEFIEGQADTLQVHDLMADFPQTEEALLVLRQKLLDRDIYRNSIISPDGEKTGILIKLQLAENDPDYEAKVARAVRTVFGRPEYQALVYHEVGAVMFDTEFQANVKRETMKFFRLSVLLTMALLYLFLRRLYAVYVPIAVVVTSVGVTFGLLAMTTTMKVTCTIILPMILFSGMCETIYIISIFRGKMTTAPSQNAAIVQAIGHCGVPTLFTSVTTIMGFLGLAFVPIIPIREAGLFCAFGTAVCFVMSVTLAPILLSFGRHAPETGKKQATAINDALSRLMRKVADLNIRHPNGILAGAVVLTLACIGAASTVTIENNFLNYMGEQFEIKRDILYVDRTMCGSSTLELVFDTGRPDGIKDPRVLREIESVQRFAATDALVMTTSSVVDVLKTVNQTLHNEDKAFHRLPDTLEEAAQYLLLYESSGGGRLERVVTFDYAKARLVLRTQSLGSSQSFELYRRIQDYVTAHVTHSTVVLTGATALKVKVIDYILQSQIISALTAFAMIAVALAILFRSLLIGFVAMIPNVFPVFFILGFMGLTGRSLGMMNAMLAAVVIGIAVDDTVHFFSHYRQARLRSNDAESALRTVFEEVGRPIVFTGVVLALGFSVIMISDLINVAEFGMMLALGVIIALLSDLFFSGSMILKFKLFEPKSGPDPAAGRTRHTDEQPAV